MSWSVCRASERAVATRSSNWRNKMVLRRCHSCFPMLHTFRGNPGILAGGTQGTSGARRATWDTPGRCRRAAARCCQPPKRSPRAIPGPRRVSLVSWGPVGLPRLAARRARGRQQHTRTGWPPWGAWEVQNAVRTEATPWLHIVHEPSTAVPGKPRYAGSYPAAPRWGQGSQATAKTAVVVESQPLSIERRPRFPGP